jgi:hypothetical protein
MGPALKRWLGIDPPNVDEKARRKPEELLCLTEKCPLQMKPLAELLPAKDGRKRTEDVAQLRTNLAVLLGDIEPTKPKRETIRGYHGSGLLSASWCLQTEVAIPVSMFFPEDVSKKRCVVAIAKDGKHAFLLHHSNLIAKLVQNGVCVCLPDLSGTGETSAGEGRGRGSSVSTVSSTQLMLGKTQIGNQLRDLRTVLAFLRAHQVERIALWGDSFVKPNSPDANLAVPLDAEPFPKQSEPMGGLLAILGGLYEPDILAVAAAGGLSDFRSVLQSPFCYLPHDVIVPGILTCGDIPDFAAQLAPKPLLIWKPVDGQNRLVEDDRLKEVFAPTRNAYAKSASALTLSNDPKLNLADWFIEQLTK